MPRAAKREMVNMAENGQRDDDASQRRSCVGPMLIGCGTALAAALIIGGVMTFLGNQFWEFVSDQSRRLEADERRASEWTAPEAGAGIEAFSPESVGPYRLRSVDDQAEFPALGIQARGFHAIYERGDRELEVTVYSMEEPEKAAVFDEVARRIEDGDRFPNHQLTRRPRVLDFRVERPALAGRFWYAKGWLVFVRSHSAETIADFTEAYLQAVEVTEKRRKSQRSSAATR